MARARILLTISLLLCGIALPTSAAPTLDLREALGSGVPGYERLLGPASRSAAGQRQYFRQGFNFIRLSQRQHRVDRIEIGFPRQEVNSWRAALASLGIADALVVLKSTGGAYRLDGLPAPWRGAWKPNDLSTGAHLLTLWLDPSPGVAANFPFSEPRDTRAATAPAPSPTAGIERLFRVIELTNLERRRRGRPPLKAVESLIEAADRHALAMAKRNLTGEQFGRFSHTTADGETPQDRCRRVGYRFFAAENCHMGSFDDPDSAVRSWIKSKAHYASMLHERHREIGVGYGPADPKTRKAFWVQKFGAPDTFPVVINNEAYRTANREVQLYIYGEGVAQAMRLSNDGVNFTDWAPFKSEVQWVLAPRQGLQSVFVQLRDAAGRTIVNWDTINVVLP